jgi:predicted glycoside hydrolase/deacetylase ChbG (UPF0249 family)
MGDGRRVVVTADDAGLRREWDEAIQAAVRSGAVTAVSVVTNGPSYPDICAYLGQTPDVDVGVHLNLIEGRPLGPPEQASSLVEAVGQFPGSVYRVLVSYLLRRLSYDQIRSQWELQIRRAVEDGLRPVHLNSHYHVHLLPGLFPIAVSLARRFDIPFVRVVDEPPWSQFGPSLSPLALAKVTGMWLVSGLNRRELRRAAGRRLPPGTTEIICHPGQSAERAPAATARFRDL